MKKAPFDGYFKLLWNNTTHLVTWNNVPLAKLRNQADVNLFSSVVKQYVSMKVGPVLDFLKEGEQARTGFLTMGEDIRKIMFKIRANEYDDHVCSCCPQ